MTLTEYIRLPHKWQWGYCDCMFFPADWIVASTGRDPVAGLRGTYFDAAGADAVLRAAGGCEALVGAKLAAQGFQRVQEPQDGDIGIIRALTGFDAAGAEVKDTPAIKFGPLWAVMSARGPMIKKLDWRGVAWRVA